MGKSDLIKYGMIAAGAYAAYWYITSYGPQGAVNDANGNPIPGAVSYWSSWFGGVASVAAGNSLPANTSAGTTSTGTTGIVTQPSTSTSNTPTTPSNGTVSTQLMATSQQIAQIQSYLKSSDLPAFQAMIPTLTYQQAASMLANAQVCTNSFNPSSGACYPPATPPVDQPVTPVSSMTGDASTVARLLTASNGVNNLSASQWNYYYTQLSGVPQTTGLGDDGSPMSVTKYLQLRQAAGLEVLLNGSVSSSGLSGLGRMGQIMPLAPNITPATNGVRNPSSLGMILPTPNAMPTTGGQGMGRLPLPPATKSPWGKLPMTSGYVN